MKDENKPATKGDVKQIVKTELKKELKDVVRKKDLEKYATKDWTEDLFRRAQDYFVPRTEFNEFRDWVIENMYTKKDHEKTLVVLDAIVQRLDDMSLDFKLLAHRTDRTEDTGENHERRIVKLERKVLT